ncbi:hypothetical protein [Streptomyces candidus]|uniref:Uncharacterized protein n=1 Tax=Streptomyces candidus TaxID=67283 RepID=A0A7X0HL97_9ACTN|nr:hypothetical protein [Streptomyces candidus]MBB6439580.1 hypothetical protein [Streptomyces candidus]GHH54651.1 hypothetical protein GCM10018773_57940 [Streptomyces candidus]
MYAQLRRWWASGSPLWQRLVVCGVLTVTAYGAAQVATILKGHVLLVFGLIVVALVALSVGTFLLVMARARGEGIYSPRWYRKFQQEAWAHSEGSPQ